MPLTVRQMRGHFEERAYVPMPAGAVILHGRPRWDTGARSVKVDLFPSR